MNDPIAGCDTDSLVKKNGKWQFRDDGRTDAKDEIYPMTDEEIEEWDRERQRELTKSEYEAIFGN